MSQSLTVTLSRLSHKVPLPGNLFAGLTQLIDQGLLCRLHLCHARGLAQGLELGVQCLGRLGLGRELLRFRFWGTVRELCGLGDALLRVGQLLTDGSQLLHS